MVSIALINWTGLASALVLASCIGLSKTCVLENQSTSSKVLSHPDITMSSGLSYGARPITFGGAFWVEARLQCKAMSSRDRMRTRCQPISPAQVIRGFNRPDCSLGCIACIYEVRGFDYS